jgi:hypothetical protein
VAMKDECAYEENEWTAQPVDGEAVEAPKNTEEKAGSRRQTTRGKANRRPCVLELTQGGEYWR